jgi:hypothetical protein
MRTCVGCGTSFLPNHGNQHYHSEQCSKAEWRNKDRPRVKRPDPPIAALNEFVRVVASSKPKEAIGYRLYCPELNIVLPVPNMGRRDGSRPTGANFSLYPLELPLIPLDTDYVLIWVYPGDSALPQSPAQYVRPGWEDDMTRRHTIGYLLKNFEQLQGMSLREYRRRRSEAANTGLTEYFRVSASPPVRKEPRSLPPHQKGNSGDDESSAD